MIGPLQFTLWKQIDPVSKCFGQVSCGDRFGQIEIRDGPGDPEQFLVRTHAQMITFSGLASESQDSGWNGQTSSQVRIFKPAIEHRSLAQGPAAVRLDLPDGSNFLPQLG